MISVLNAPYLVRSNVSFWAKLRRLLGQRSALRPAVALRPPVDGLGNDCLGLRPSLPSALLRNEGHASPLWEVEGRARALTTVGDTLLSDLWVLEPETWRVSEGVDFRVETDSGESVLVTYERAPLIIAQPRLVHARHHIPSFHPETQKLIPSSARTGQAWAVTVREGDRVHIVGVCRQANASQRQYDPRAWDDGYRAGPRTQRVIRDDDDTRLVISVSESR